MPSPPARNPVEGGSKHQMGEGGKGPGAHPFTLWQWSAMEMAEADKGHFLAMDLSHTRSSAAPQGRPLQGLQDMSLSLESLMRDSAIEASRPSLAAEIFSFLLVGGMAALCFVGLSMLMIDLRTGLPDWIVSALCYAAFIVPVYLAHRAYSFRSKTPHRVALPRYIAVQLSALFLAAIFSYVCYNVLGIQTASAAFLVIGLTSAVNFVVLKAWAFAHRG
jgi:putative flippase GtrA